MPELGECDFAQVAMQPGKPQGFGLIGDDRIPMIMVPGNPVSSFVSFEAFVRPVIRKLMGVQPYVRIAVKCRGGPRDDLDPGPAPVRPGHRQRRPRPASRQVELAGGHGSHLLGGLARANALVILPEDTEFVAAGEDLDVWLLDEAHGVSHDRGPLPAPERSRRGPDGRRLGQAGHRADGHGRGPGAAERRVRGRAPGRTVPKGDALAVARIAGIQGAKKTPDLIPLCHPLLLSGVDVTAEVTDDGVEITATVRTTERTGVEMEALTAVSVAGLARDRHDQGHRPGGGDHRRTRAGQVGRAAAGTGSGEPTGRAVTDRTALVITVSTRAAAGVYADTSGPIIADALAELGFEVSGPLVVCRTATRWATPCAPRSPTGHAVVITTGGTGLNPDDHTPEQTRAVVEREIPQLAAAIARYGVDHGVPTAVLSRGVAGVAGADLDHQPARLERGRPGRHGGARPGAGARGQPAAGRGPLSEPRRALERPGWPRGLRHVRAAPLAGDPAARPGGAGPDAPAGPGRLGAGPAAERRLAAAVGGHPAAGRGDRPGDVPGPGADAEQAGPGRPDAALAGVLRRPDGQPEPSSPAS